MSNSLLAPRGLDDPTYDLPDGWTASRLVNECDIFGGGRLGLTKERDYRSSGVIAFSAAGPDGYVDAVEIDGKDGVVLSAIGANCGRCFFASGQWTTLANVQAIIPRHNIDAKYLFYYVNRDGYWARSGSAQPFIKPSSIQTSWVAYPPSKREQSKIAEVLSTVDRVIAQTEALIAKQQRIKTGLMQDLLTRGIDEHGQLRSEATHAFKDSPPLGRIPVEWEVCQVRELCRLGRGRVISSLEIERNPGVYPVYSSQSKDDGLMGRLATFDFDGEYVTWTTDGAYAGTVFHRHGQFNCTNVCGTLQAQRQVSMRFLAYQLATVSKRYVSYVGNPKLMNGVMGRILLAVPSRYEEQTRIAKYLEDHDAGVHHSQLQQTKLQSLKTALMQDLLTGKVRVTPLLEPAEEATT